jgi:ring-1,2-phenylacetyl-CoA epoxidase subunit PaaE
MAAEQYTIMVTGIREDVPGVKTFTIAMEDGSSIPYKAGQFITLVFTHHGKEERRSFSISSCPDANDPLAFTVKRLDNGAYSRYLIERVKVGDRLQTTGVAGLFTLPDDHDTYEQVFFFAAGIGITPVISLVKSVLHTQPHKQVVLVYSNRSQDEVVFYNELRVLAVKFADRFQLELLYSTAFNLERARLNKALVPVLLDEYTRTSKDKLLFYICGPYNYMRMVTYALEEEGAHEEQIRKEHFNTNNRDTLRAAPPDKLPHNVTIVVGGTEHTFTVVYPETILQAAKKHGLSLPYSCEVGRCGSCAALCTKGEVWLSYNEVLMESDLKKGVVLTCVGYPVNGDVTIEA